jgi:hypothetical protein
MRLYKIALLVFLVPAMVWAARPVTSSEIILRTLTELMSGIAQSDYFEPLKPGALHRAKVEFSAHLTGLEKCLNEKQDPKAFRRCLLSITSPLAEKTWLELSPAPECR